MRYKVPQVPNLIILLVVYKLQYLLFNIIFLTLIILTYTILVVMLDRSFYEYTTMMVADTYQVRT